MRAVCYAVLRSFVCCADGSHVCLACVCESVHGRAGHFALSQSHPSCIRRLALVGRGHLVDAVVVMVTSLATTTLTMSGLRRHVSAELNTFMQIATLGAYCTLATWAARTTPTIRLPITTATQLGATHHSSHSANPVSLYVTCRQQQWWRRLRRLRARLPRHLHSHLLPH
jgi:hypothetical protein